MARPRNEDDIRKMTEALNLPDALTKATNGDFKVTPTMQDKAADWQAEDDRKEREDWPNDRSQPGAGRER